MKEPRGKEAARPCDENGAPLEVWTCDECGGRRLTGRASVHLNTGAVEWYGDKPYCEDCEGETFATLKAAGS